WGSVLGRGGGAARRGGGVRGCGRAAALEGPSAGRPAGMEFQQGDSRPQVLTHPIYGESLSSLAARGRPWRGPLWRIPRTHICTRLANCTFSSNLTAWSRHSPQHSASPHHVPLAPPPDPNP